MRGIGRTGTFSASAVQEGTRGKSSVISHVSRDLILLYRSFRDTLALPERGMVS
jgi:hypothetical protein